MASFTCERRGTKVRGSSFWASLLCSIDSPHALAVQQVNKNILPRSHSPRNRGKDLRTPIVVPVLAGHARPLGAAAGGSSALINEPAFSMSSMSCVCLGTQLGRVRLFGSGSDANGGELLRDASPHFLVFTMSLLTSPRWTSRIQSLQLDTCSLPKPGSEARSGRARTPRSKW